MPVVVGGSSPTPRQANQLASEVARSVGKENSATARGQALDYLNAVINDVNLACYGFMRTVDSDTAFTASTADYTLTSSAYQIEKVQVVDAVNASPVWTVWPWDSDAFKDFDQTLSSTPARYYTVRNLHTDNKITFLGTPGTTEVSKYKFRVSYFQRIPILASDGDTLNVPRELDRVLVEGAKFYMRDMDESADSPKAARSWASYQRLLARLNRLNADPPDNHPRFRFRASARI